MVGSQPGAGSHGMLNLWAIGLAVVLLTTLAINGILNRAWALPAVLALGAWLLLSPWLIGFCGTAPLMWNSVICGALLFVFAGWGFAVERRRKSPDRVVVLLPCTDEEITPLSPRHRNPCPTPRHGPA